METITNLRKWKDLTWGLIALVIMIGLFSSGLISLLLSDKYSIDFLYWLGLELISAGLIAVFLDVILRKDLLKIATETTVKEIMPMIEEKMEKMDTLIKSIKNIRYVVGIENLYYEYSRFLRDVLKTSREFYIYGSGIKLHDPFYGEKGKKWLEYTREALKNGAKYNRLQTVDCDEDWLKSLLQLKKDHPEHVEIRYKIPKALMPQMIINPHHEVILAPSETEFKGEPIYILITDEDLVHTFTVYFKEQFSNASENIKDPIQK